MASASRRGTSTGSSSASTVSTGPAAGRPEAPDSAWPSCAMSPPTTGAPCRCGPAKAPGRRSRSAFPPAPARWRSRSRRQAEMATETTVLVVEDEESFIEALTIGLKREGFRVQVARDGAQALALFDAVAPDLVLLDVMLPKVSGIDVCRQLRKKTQIPIIMVTAKGAEIDTVVGLEVGADDYVTKPYRLRELVARMRAVLRRAPREDHDDAGPEALEVGDVRLDPERHEVWIRGERTQMPLKEFELLGLLLANAGRVLTRET